ncbi:MAG TPA: NAD-dependent epimerase/dehydratase family protein [Rhizomicrobium sp.]|jgi:nucleoside-diphosphate-sugar epimerase|nr:NAD-dependent epimerase/dehydratase family protein [Rhizomicrobium sp.]
MAPRILIVGGTRFIGAHAARQLVETGAEVTVLHRGQSESPLPAAVRHIRDPRAAYPITEFPDAAVRQDWNVVIHMVMMGEADAQAAASAFEGRAGRLVMISSGDVYRAYGRLTGHEPGPPDPVPLTEDAPLRGVLYPYRAQAEEMGAYAHDYEKILAERVTREAALSSVILRLPKVYGSDDNGDLATIYAFASQPRWRWTHGHVENVACAIVLAATHPAAPGRTYNVGEAVTPSMGERLAHLPAKPARRAPPFRYEQDMVIDTTRIRAELGFCEVLEESAAMWALAERGA